MPAELALMLCLLCLAAAQARNVAITVRTIIVGLMYLATFTFSANALGLAGALLRLAGR